MLITTLYRLIIDQKQNVTDNIYTYMVVDDGKGGFQLICYWAWLSQGRIVRRVLSVHEIQQLLLAHSKAGLQLIFPSITPPLHSFIITLTCRSGSSLGLDKTFFETFLKNFFSNSNLTMYLISNIEVKFIQTEMWFRGDLTEDPTQRVGLDTIGRLIGRDSWVKHKQKPQAVWGNVGNFSPPTEEKIKIISGRSKIRLGSAGGTMHRNHVIISHLRGRKPTVLNWNISGQAVWLGIVLHVSRRNSLNTFNHYLL